MSGVALAISTFRNDETVAHLLDDLGAAGAELFSEVIVVDSLGSGELIDRIEDRALAERVRYHNADRNIGSAGNLATRLRLGAEAGADYIYAINHDGYVDAEHVRKLLAFAQKTPRAGAVYPLAYYPGRGRYNLTPTSRLPLPFFGPTEPPEAPQLRAYWGSSNGALYAAAPVREGLCPWDDLWMGWEDLEYGWQLERHGWTQHIVCEAVFTDDYEFRRAGRLPMTVSDKAPWYAYYHARNLILSARRGEEGPTTWALIAARIAQELGLIAATRDRKKERASLIARGVRDGLRGMTGKSSVP